MDMPTNAGWYDDPSDENQLRYFDGVIWTSHTTPRSTRPAAAAQQAGQQQFPGQGHPPQYPGQEQSAVPPQQQAPTSPQFPGAQQPSQWTAPQAPGNPQFPGASQPSQWNAPAYPGMAAGPTTPDGQPLAGYWQRVGAYLIDSIISGIIMSILGGYFLWKAIAPALDQFRDALDRNDPNAFDGLTPQFDLPNLIAFAVIAAIVGFAYQVFFLSRTGATPGKMAMGISVRLRERPGVLSVGDACKRAFLQTALSLLSNIPVMGSLASLASLLDLLWPAWDNKKQALHDKIAATNVVVGKQPRPVQQPAQPPQG
jgi:uncharacterized RDD family membrane protein YckC